MTATAYVSCDTCFAIKGTPPYLVYTRDGRIHNRLFEDDHVVQMQCDCRYLHSDIVSFDEAIIKRGFPRARRWEAINSIAVLAAVLCVGLAIGLVWGQAAEREANGWRIAVAEQGLQARSQ